MRQPRVLLILLFACISLNSAYAVDEIFQMSVKGSNVTIGKKFVVKDDKFLTTDTTKIDTTLSIKNMIILQLDEAPGLVLPGAFECTVQVKIWYWDRAGTVIHKTRELVISYDSTRINPFNYRTLYLENNYYKDSVKIIDISYSENGGTPVTTVPDFFSVTAEIQISRIYNFNCSTSPLLYKDFGAFSDPQNSFLQTVKWPVYTGADEYDFEWTFFDDSSKVEADYAISPSLVDFNELFKNNATRVTVKNTFYTINKIYTAGTIYYRLRAVHYDGLGNRITTPWSGKGAPTVIANKFHIDWYHEDFNWTASTVFSEEGKKNSTVSYFDGSQRNRQTVSTVNTDTFSIVSQSIYDHQGRPALTVLPTPVLQWNTYYHSLFNTHGGDLYDRTHFDVGDCSFTPSNMDTTAGASMYYSTEVDNDFPFDAFIPRAYGFPFAVTEYTPDLTGRIKRQSSVGFPLRIGSGHETKYFYGTPAQEELDMVFGNEAGKSGHYLKNLVIDPNEQISVSYLDAHGRTIATALSGPSASNLNALPSNQSPHILTIDLLKNNIKNAPFTSDHYSFLASHADDYVFHYEASKDELEHDDCIAEGVCYDCYYDFLLRITDNCNNTTLPSDTNYLISFNNFPEGSPIPFDTLCNSSNGEVEQDFTIAFEAGSYEIQKTATVSQQAIDYYAKKYLEQNICLVPFDTFLSHAMDAIDFDGCNLTCEECNASLGTESEYLASFIEELELTGKEPDQMDTTMALSIYNQMVNECADLCNGISSCDLLYQQMLQDVSIGGQYGSYTYDNTTQEFDSTNATSVFTSDWQSPYPPYQDEMGKPAYILYLNDSLYLPQDVPLTTFLSHWQPSWANSLVKYHPEYCYWTYCELNSESEDYNQDMLDVNTYEEAYDLGYLDPLEMNGYPSLPDPFFDDGEGEDMADEMIIKMNDYFNTASIWEYAAWLISCNGDTGCVDFGEACEGENDQHWKLFRSLYLNTKYYYFDVLREDYVNADTLCHSNKCIGLGDRSWLINNTYIDTSDCNESEYFYGFQPHVIHWNTFGPAPDYSSGDTTEIKENAAEFSGELLIQNCDSACYHNVERWISQLADCFPPIMLSGLRDSLYMLCVSGCSIDHPYGVTSLPGSDTTESGFHDLQDILEFFEISYPGDTTNCSALNLTISDPSDAFSANVVITTDSCLCSRLEEYKDLYDITVNYQALSDSIFANFGYTMTAEDLGILDTACTVVDCKYLREPVHIAPMMVCGKEECIDCETMSYYHNLFLETFLSVDFANYPTLFTNYLNDQLDFALTFEDYKTFMDSCTSSGYPFPEFYDGDWMGDTIVIATYDTTYTIEWILGYDFSEQKFYSVGTNGFSIYSNIYPFEVSSGDTFINLLDDSLHLTVVDSFCVLPQFPIGDGPPNYHIVIDLGDIGLVPPLSIPPAPHIVNFTIVSSCMSFGLNCSATVGSSSITAFSVVDTIFGAAALVTRILCNEPVLASFSLDTTDCLDQLMSIAAANAQASYQSYLDSVTQTFITNYITECMELNETFNVKAPYNEHHFTLYYYDQAGNLVKTIPPRGVDTLSASERTAVEAHRSNPASPAKYPKHVDSTRYWYNTLNKPIKQSTIDGGITQFWYDRIGRLVVSQNAKQEPDDLYSYTLYDDLGRINEVGQLKQNHVMITDTSINPIKLSLWIANGTEREQVTRTFYDEPITTIPDLSQDNLRNRVATVTFQKVYDTDEEVYNHASHYSYDIAGNVKTLVQDVPELEDYVQRFKRIDYEYDLISGKVNKIHYEKDSVDQFIHQYAYDEENRLIQAKTSADGLLWDIDADYQYYAHGPLARIELGERQVQGIDYAYTLQGWLKGINGLDLNLYRDMGRDGNTGASANKKIGRDVYGMVIGYFEDDYYPAGGNSRNFEPSYSPSSFSSASPSLYNGNIRNIGYTIKGLTPLTIGYAYKYDQLNRLAEVKPYDTFNSSNYKWSTSGSGMTSYKEELSYDANGNILTYLRKGAPSQVNMDNMTYNYVSGTNKLVQVEDAVSASNYSIDIDQQVSTNYLYDNSGNLIKDKKEKLDITWTAYGKVDSIYNDNTDLAINFNYDASQNRLSKRVITTASSDTVTSYYIRDAQGNIMAIYEIRDDTVRWIEQDLYGSSRLGVLNPDSVVYPPTTYSQFFHHLQGKKQYELTNHLGNVLTTINDRKIGQDTATGDGLYDYWVAAQISGQDYYSGGMVMPDRNFSYENYGFGFNGKESMNEVNGSKMKYDYGFRIYDPRIARFLSRDPLFKSYPFYTPYQFAGNNSILFIDLDGLERDFYKMAKKQIRCFNNWDIHRKRVDLGIDFGEIFRKKPEAGSPSFSYIKSKEAPDMKPIKTEGIGMIIHDGDENRIEPIARNPTIDGGKDSKISRSGTPPRVGEFGGTTLKKDTRVNIDAGLSEVGVRYWDAPITESTSDYFGALAQELKGTGISEISIRLTVFDALGTGHATNEIIGGDPTDESYGNKLTIYNALLNQANQAAEVIRKSNPNIKVSVNVDITIDQSKEQWQTIIIK